MTERVIEQMPITDLAKWRQWREQDVTASVAGALFGVHKHYTPYELWALKSGLIPDPEETEAMERGKLLEPVAIKLMGKKRPDWQIAQPNTYYRDPRTHIGATPDTLVMHPERGRGTVQIKTVDSFVFRQEWVNDDGDVEPPLWIAVQASVEADLTGSEWAAVGALRWERGLHFDLIEIPLIPGLMPKLEAEVAGFLQRVKSGEAPDPDLGRDAETIARVYQPTGPQVDLSDDAEVEALVEERLLLSTRKRDAEKRLTELKASLLIKLGGAGIGLLAGGRFLEAKRVQRDGYTVNPTEYVDLRIKSPKKSRRAA